MGKNTEYAPGSANRGGHRPRIRIVEVFPALTWGSRIRALIDEKRKGLEFSIANRIQTEIEATNGRFEEWLAKHKATHSRQKEKMRFLLIDEKKNPRIRFRHDDPFDLRRRVVAILEKRMGRAAIEAHLRGLTRESALEVSEQRKLIAARIISLQGAPQEGIHIRRGDLSSGLFKSVQHEEELPTNPAPESPPPDV